MGLPVPEIARRVYGSDNYRNRQRVRNIIYLYGKRLGLLNAQTILNDKTGEEVDDSGIVIDSLITDNYFYENSIPTPPQTFLGGYSNIIQLKASLNKEELAYFKILEWIGRFLSIAGVRRESVIKQTAALIAKRNTHLKLKYSDKLVAAAVAAIALIFHNYNINDFVNIVKEYVEPRTLIKVIYEVKLPNEIANSLALRYVTSSLNGKLFLTGAYER